MEKNAVMPPSKETGKQEPAPVYEMITAAPAQSFVVARHDFPADRARWNYHPEYELHLITASNGRYVVGGHVGTFCAGSLFLIGPNLPHNWLSSLEQDEIIPGRDLLVQIQSDWLQGLIGLCPEFEVLGDLLNDAACGVEFYGPSLKDFGQQMEMIEKADPIDRVAMVIKLLTDLARAPRRVLCSTQYSLVAKGNESRTVDTIIKFLLSVNLREIRQADVARHVKMTPSAFSRLFLRATGDTFTSFVRRLRISRACELLVTTSKSVGVVGSEAGFGNLSNFNRIFLDEKHMTPREYRREAKMALNKFKLPH
ncbi:AraC family transcriptional regulator [Gluconobacter thailandicus]|uniref:AraC family transcriptional regulator n=2 Tax=Gluconobacter thailandicus TaxID=257438 RepID=UPI00037183B2|nr:helix-turn-helix domain-containing protein [Gluconobacter thailandicus]